MSDFFSLKEKIVKRAEADLEFRKELNENPKSAIEKYYPSPDGQPIPDGLDIIICEDTANKVYLNIAPTSFHPDCY